MWNFKLLNRFRSNESGNFGLVAAISIGVIGLGVGVALDTTNLTNKKVKLQQVVDNAVLAGAIHNGSASEREIAIRATFKANISALDESCKIDTINLVPAQNRLNTSQVVSSSSETSPSDAQDFVELTARCNLSSLLGGFSPNESNDVAAMARAKIELEARPLNCFYALQKTGTAFEGSSGAIRTDCEIHSNGDTFFGAGSIEAPVINTAGKLLGCSHDRCDNGRAGADVIADPWANKTWPVTSAQCTRYNYVAPKIAARNQTGEPRPAKKGVYCGGMDMRDGNVNFEPGTYVIRNGDLTTSGTGEWRGEGVTFVFEGTGRLNKTTAGGMYFTAPETGPYAGALFVEGANAVPGQEYKFAAGQTTLGGVVYLPNQNVELGAGSVDSKDEWNIWVVNKFEASSGLFTFRKFPVDANIPREFNANADVVRLMQ